MPKLSDSEAYQQAQEEYESGSGSSSEGFIKDRELVGVPFNVVAYSFRDREESYDEKGNFYKARKEVNMTIMFTSEDAANAAPRLKPRNDTERKELQSKENPGGYRGAEAGVWYSVTSGAKQIVAVFEHWNVEDLPMEDVVIDEDYTRKPFNGYRQLILRDYDMYLKLDAERKKSAQEAEDAEGPFEQKESKTPSPNSRPGSRPSTGRPGATSSGARPGGSR